MWKTFRNVGGYDISCDEFRKIYRKSLESEYIYHCIDRSKERDEGRYCICNESGNNYNEWTPEPNPFELLSPNERAKQSLFLFSRTTIKWYNKKNEVDLKDLDELANVQSNAKQIRLVGKLSKKSFHYNTKRTVEPITKAVTDTSQNLHEETKSTKNAIEELDESNVHVKLLELTNQNGVIQSSLIRPISKPLVTKNRNHLGIIDDLDFINWIGHVIRKSYHIRW